MVTHVLKDGTVLNDIKGHLVKKEDVPTVYVLINKMNEHSKKEEKK